MERKSGLTDAVAVLVTDTHKYSDGDVAYWIIPNDNIPGSVEDGVGIVLQNAPLVEPNSIVVVRKTDRPVMHGEVLGAPDNEDYVYWELVTDDRPGE
jgi:hypothetical protein